MRKEKKELVRMQSILENDRMKTGENFYELVCNDVGAILSDYFEFSGDPKIKIEKINDRYKVEITIISSRIKSFDNVPKI